MSRKDDKYGIDPKLAESLLWRIALKEERERWNRDDGGSEKLKYSPMSKSKAELKDEMDGCTRLMIVYAIMFVIFIAFMAYAYR